MRSGIRERTIAGNYAKLGGKRKPTTGYDDAVSVIIDTFPKKTVCGFCIAIGIIFLYVSHWRKTMHYLKFPDPKPGTGKPHLHLPLHCPKDDKMKDIVSAYAQPRSGQHLGTHQGMFEFGGEEEFRKVCMGGGTERPYSGKFGEEHGEHHGHYRCECCDARLFHSETMMNDHKGWPTFWGSTTYDDLTSSTAVRADHNCRVCGPRTELHCSTCGAHLGYVYDAPETPSGVKFVVNSICMLFYDESEEAGKIEIAQNVPDSHIQSDPAKGELFKKVDGKWEKWTPKAYPHHKQRPYASMFGADDQDDELQI